MRVGVRVEERVVRPEVLAEPAFEFAGQAGFVVATVILDAIHDVAQLIQQGLVIALVIRVRFVTRITHEFFFEREVGRDLREYLTE